jgi:hypothetical protein
MTSLRLGQRFVQRSMLCLEASIELCRRDRASPPMGSLDLER